MAIEQEQTLLHGEALPAQVEVGFRLGGEHLAVARRAAREQTETAFEAARQDPNAGCPAPVTIGDVCHQLLHQSLSALHDQQQAQAEQAAAQAAQEAAAQAAQDPPPPGQPDNAIPLQP